MERRTNIRTAALIDAAIQATSSHGMAGAFFELIEQGLPLETAIRVLTHPSERRHYFFSLTMQGPDD
jgi:hypothetical protein